MRKIESDYLDEYKALDRALADAFECKSGVSEYINRMEAVSETYSGLVSGWKDDYRLLKHLRWLRNKISHETGDTECEKKDLEDLRAFSRRVSKKKDPLAELERIRKDIGAQKKDGFGLGRALLWLALLAAVIFAVHLFFS